MLAVTAAVPGGRECAGSCIRIKKEPGTSQYTLPGPDKLHQRCNANHYQQYQLTSGMFVNYLLGAIAHPYPVQVRALIPTCAGGGMQEVGCGMQNVLPQVSIGKPAAGNMQ